MTRTPDDVLHELRGYVAELMRGPDALEAAILAAEQADDAADLAFQKALLTADGSVAERTAHARIASADLRDRAHIEAAKVARVKAKIRALEVAVTAAQTELKYMREQEA